ncbi:hypothetical protein [Burkholderia ubonensis]|uniref:hypothetical protein n=1 Tax=Burkholderia ubonensis TaxID=101571 RepID=UPI000A5D3F42|nr:hypothetical protein [Burkholderia ubonensis]
MATSKIGIARAALFCACSILLMSCTHTPSLWDLRYGNDKPQYSYILNSRGPNGDSPSSTGDLMIWNPNTNAAYITKEGKACIQAADVYRIASTAAAAQLKADTPGSKAATIDASASSSSTESAMALSSQDVRGTFLSIALFNLCILASNDKVASTEIATVFMHAVDQAAAMSVPTTTAAHAPDSETAHAAKPASGAASANSAQPASDTSVTKASVQ